MYVGIANGDVGWAFTTLGSALPLMQAGRIKLIAIAAPQRSQGPARRADARGSGRARRDGRRRVARDRRAARNAARSRAQDQCRREQGARRSGHPAADAHAGLRPGAGNVPSNSPTRSAPTRRNTASSCGAPARPPTSTCGERPLRRQRARNTPRRVRRCRGTADRSARSASSRVKARMRVASPPAAASIRNCKSALSSRKHAATVAVRTSAATVVMPCPRIITATQLPRLAASWSPSSRVRINPMRSYSATPPLNAPP